MTATQLPIAIVGMGVLFPGSPDLRTYWTNLVEGNDAITDVPPRRWDARYHQPNPAADRPDQIPCRRGGFVDDIATVQPLRLGLSEADVRQMDAEQLIALQVATEAIDDAGGLDRLGDQTRIGVILGRGGYHPPGLLRLDQRVRAARQLVHTLGTLLPALAEEELERVRECFVDALGPVPTGAGLGLMPNLAAAGVAARLDLRGPVYTVDAACASSLVAVDRAVAELADRRCDAVIAGGLHHGHDVTMWSLFTQLGVVSTGQRSRPLDAAADGLLLGEGTGLVVLKRLADAEAAGDRVYAVVRGTGISSGGQRRAVTEPDPACQALAVERAWEAAGLDPRRPGSVGLIEAHGSGTPAADAAELEVLRRVFGPASDVDLAVVGSVKSMIGHAMPAAGIAGLIKAALAVHHGLLLPTLHCDRPHPAMEATRFRPLATACPWESSGPRRAGVNAFGFGGVNAHVVLEQSGEDREPTAAPAAPAAPGTGRVAVTEPEQILRFAAPTPDALIDLLDGDDATLRRRGAEPPRYLGPGSRLGLVGPSQRRLAVARRVATGARGGGWAAWRGRNDVWLSSEPLLAPAPGRIAFVYPGLEAEFSPHIDDVAEHFGLPLPDLSAGGVGQHGSAVLRVGRTLERALRRMGIVPDALAGHSLGEWSAMYASGMFDEADADELIFGPAMDDLAALDVDYASLACPVEQAERAIADHPDVVVSHDNAPQQTVVCGPPASIRALAAAQRRDNVLVQVLPFRSGFHTPRLAPYLDEIGRRAARLPIRRGGAVELWSATLVGRYPDDPEEIRALFLRHLVEPVRFRPTVLAMYEAGIRVFIQVGQGRLGNLVDDTLGHLPHLTIAANTSRRGGLDQLRRVAVALWVEGGTPDFDALASRSDVDELRAQMTRPEPPRSVPPGTAEPDGLRLRRVPVRLDAGGALVSLDPRVLPAPPGTGHLAVPPGAGHLAATAGLTSWARRDPVAHELLELITDTTRAAVEALQLAGGADPAADGRDWLDPPDPDGLDPIESTTTRLRVCPETMPFLLDHCLAPQRAGWPDLADRRPVVPATTMIRLMMDLAEKAAPGRIAVSVSDVRFERWLPAAPATELTVQVQPIGADTVSVAFGEFARATVRLARDYPDVNRALWPYDGSREEPPAVSGPDLYAKRWMFHGPQFRGVVGITGHSDNHARAVLTPTAAPGSLLDAAGQLLAYFARVHLPERYVIFPGGIDRIDVYAPEPAPDTPVSCLMWVPWHDDDRIQAHFQLVTDGTVMMEVSGWLSRRFDLRPEVDEAFRFPERATVGTVMPGGWTMVGDLWSDLASREIFADRYLGGAERDEMRSHPPRGRRHWLLGRIAVKDAVRALLWEAGAGPVFPAELRVANTAAGVPHVLAEHGLDLPPVRVSVSHSGDLAVAVAAPAGGADGPIGVGIDVEEIRTHRPETVEAALAPAERRLLDELVERTGLAAEVWFTRFWTAKEAAAKAVGTGLGGSPQRFVVHCAQPVGNQGVGAPAAGAPVRLLVTTPSGATVEIHLAEVSNPPYLRDRDYVVAWTPRAEAPTDQPTSGGRP